MDTSNENSKQITVKFDHPLAQTHLNWLTIHHDLTFIVDCCARLNHLFSKGPADKIVIKGLWFGAVAVYARCFSTGTRNGLKDNDVPENLRDAHKSILIHVRNRHLAHVVNQLQKEWFGIVLETQDAKPKHLLYALPMATEYNPEPTEISTLSNLAAKMQAIAKDKLEESWEIVAKYIRALSADELALLPPLEMYIPTKEEQMRWSRQRSDPN